MGILLLFIARLLFVVLAPINFIAVIIKYGKSHGFLRVYNKYATEEAKSIDVIANQSYRTLWRLVFINSKSKFSFGKKGQTISYVLGKNQIDKTLSIFGWLIVYLLWLVDYKAWKHGGHCIKAVKTYENEK